VKNGQIFAHKSTARGSLDLEYLDETSRRKVSLRERADMDQQIGKKLKHFTDYASKETLGQVHAGGFLHHSIRINPDGTSTAPSQLSNAERKHRITETWQKHLAKFSSTAKRPVIAHRLVFSMSKGQRDALTDVGINPDQVLHSTMKKVMRRFNERYHPNDSIGYAYGIHHDTAHLHVHVIKSWFEVENSRWPAMLPECQLIDRAAAAGMSPNDGRQIEGFCRLLPSSLGTGDDASSMLFLSYEHACRDRKIYSALFRRGVGRVGAKSSIRRGAKRNGLGGQAARH
jgi:hypothetical protein